MAPITLLTLYYTNVQRRRECRPPACVPNYNASCRDRATRGLVSQYDRAVLRLTAGPRFSLMWLLQHHLNLHGPLCPPGRRVREPCSF